jgi:diguanylate cyclase (GGDEF)-like protein
MDAGRRPGQRSRALILPYVTSRRAVEAMVRRRLAIAQEPLIAGRHKIDVRVSAGIAIYPQDGRHADMLMRHSDAAMYSAKREGRSVVFHLTHRKGGSTAR